MKGTKKIFFFLLILTGMFFLVNAVPTDPVIKVVFDEVVNPITIQKKLTDYSGKEFELFEILNSSDNITFQYKPKGLLDEGNYIFTISAEDLYGNRGATQKQTFTVTLVDFNISIIKPIFGVSAVLPFDIEIRTTRYGECKYSFTDRTYEQMELSFSTIDNQLHSLSDFQNTGDFYVKCKDHYDKIYSNNFTLVHDTSDPIINSLKADDVFQIPVQTNVKIDASEPAFCKYSLNDDSKDYSGMALFPGTNENDINFYKNNHEYILSSNLADAQTNYLYVICKDRADKLTAKTQDDFIVNTAQDPIVIINSPKSPYYTSNLTVMFDVTTNKNADCRYGPNDLTDYNSYPYSLSGSATTHTSIRQFSLGGAYTYYVKCRFANEGDQPSVSTTFTIDTTPPTMVYVNASDPNIKDEHQGYTFYTDRLFGKWLAGDNETSITGYKYNIYLDKSYYTDELIASGETSSTEGWITGLSLNNSKKYYFKVSAKNLVGLWSLNKTSNSITVDTSLEPVTCSDGEKNQDETDRDCGGSCSPCINGKNCSEDGDCVSYNCINGSCAKATCSDNKKNQNESSVDCGGPNCAKCSNGKSCSTHTDCLSGACVSNVCISVDICSNGNQDSSETDTDCGGACTPCDDGKKCKIGVDCKSKSCKNNVCVAPTCDDNVQNGDETGKDCGGNLCNSCKDGEKCKANSDCLSTVCKNSVCVESDDKDKDGLPNDWEEKYGLDSDNYDTDGDGISDADEDLDNDGLSNLEEYTHGTDPTKYDTDGDGYSDKEEIDLGTDPNDPNSKPRSKIWLYLILIIILILIAAGSYYGYNIYNKYAMEKKVNEKKPAPIKPLTSPPIRGASHPTVPALPIHPPFRVPVQAVKRMRWLKTRKTLKKEKEKSIQRKSIFDKFSSGEKEKTKGFEEIKESKLKPTETVLISGKKIKVSKQTHTKKRRKRKKKPTEDVFVRLAKALPYKKNK